MTYAHANNTRCLAADLIDKLRAKRQVGQLLMLRIQLDRAIDDVGNTVPHPARTLDEMRWMEKGTKGKAVA